MHGGCMGGKCKQEIFPLRQDDIWTLATPGCYCLLSGEREVSNQLSLTKISATAKACGTYGILCCSYNKQQRDLIH